MEQDPHARIDQLQSDLEILAGRITEITRRLDTIQAPVPSSRPTPRVPPTPEHSQPRAPYKPANTPAPERVAKPPRKPFDPKAFEWVLGIKGLMLLGVIIVIVGVGMFLKLAHDEGWIASLPPATRCGAAAVFGMALVLLGETLRRKLSPLASSGFTAAGIATLYASIYAAFRMYGLLNIETTFALLFLTTLSGIVLGAIADRVMLALLSLVGAFTVPILLSTGDPSYFVLPCYLLFLLATGLVLSGGKGGAYAHARRFAWWGTGIIGSLWLADMHERTLTSPLVFITLAWAMTVAELALSARFFKSLRDRVSWTPACNAGFIRDPEGELSFNPVSLLTLQARWVNALFGATVWAVVAAGATIRSHNPDLIFLAPLSFALLSAAFVAIAMRLGSGPRPALTTNTASPASLFLSALAINASLLLVATIATALGGWVEVVAWLAVGLAAIETSRRLRFRAVGLFGGVMLAFAIGRLGTYDLWQYMDDEPIFMARGIALTPWSAQVAAGALACAIAAWRFRHATEKHIAAPLALWVLAASLLHNQSEIASLGCAWVALAALGAWFTLPLTRANLQQNLRINAIILLSIASLILTLDQLDHGQPRINPVEMVIVLIGWAAIAALPRAGCALRTTSAALAIVAALLALGRLEQTQGIEAMLVWQSVLLGAVVLLGKYLFRWSLSEMGSALILLLACVWGIHELVRGPATLTQPPLSGLDALAVALMLSTILYAGLTLTKRRLADDAPKPEFADLRRTLTNALLGAFWLVLLLASTLEIIRALHAFFDSSSAQGAGVSIWWSVYAVASVALGFRLPRPLRWAGLTLLCIVAAKVLLFDTMTLAPTARIIAAITVGLIIIATGVLYTKLVERLSGLTNPNSDESGSNHEPDPGEVASPGPE